jgi:hypothetical protein
MRSIKLVPLLTAAAALLALAPAGASARRAAAHAHATRPCHVRLEAPKAPVANGETVTIKGTLLCPKSVSPAGREVTVLQQAAPKSGFAPVGPAVKTEAGGAFQVVTAPLSTNSVFYAVAEGAQSAQRTVRVSAPITSAAATPPDGAQLFTAGGHGLTKQNAVTFAGEVSPADVGAAVVLQRENATGAEDWRVIDRSFVDKDGKYSIVHHFRVPGEANIRLVVHPRKVNAPAATSPVSYEISQAQNPALTIETSADPLLYAQQATIKGVVAGAAAKTPVTLLARTAGGPFAPVASAVTGDKGAYEFAKQTPLKNTAYKVTAASAQSAVLFQGVKYALTVSPAVGTIAAGQPVTFSGAVLPALVGHVVYLERQGPLKLGWRVVDVGTVAAPSNPMEAAPFSIVHAFRTPGTARLRVKIPGDPGNQGAAGAPFELTVTPTPASALAPEAPGNSRLPSEGQL